MAGRIAVVDEHWDVSCAGHVEESDYVRGPDDELDAVYAAVAARELEEELGVVVLRTADTVLRAPAEPGLAAPLRLLDRIAPEPGVHYEQMQLFEARSDGPFVLQAEEVEEHRLLTRAETDALLAGPEPVTHALRWLLARGYWPAGYPAR